MVLLLGYPFHKSSEKRLRAQEGRFCGLFGRDDVTDDVERLAKNRPPFQLKTVWENRRESSFLFCPK
jgi:hypothetical protein